MFRNLNELPLKNLSYPIYKSNTFSTSFPSPGPGRDAGFIYVKQQPQNTRKQNGITGFAIYDPEDACGEAHLR